MTLQHCIEEKLTRQFHPLHLEVHNDSHKHNVPPDAESHFRVILVSEHFQNQKLLLRHKAINKVLAQELAGAVHALGLHAYTPEEWARVRVAPESPECLGGKAAEPGG